MRREGLVWLSELGCWITNNQQPTTHTSLSPIRFVNNKIGCTRLVIAIDQAYQLLGHGRWFSPGTPAFFTTKTAHHNMAEILLKVA